MLTDRQSPSSVRRSARTSDRLSVRPGVHVTASGRLDVGTQLSSSQFGQTMPHPSWFSSVRGNRTPHPRHVCNAASGTAAPPGTGPPVPFPDRLRYRRTRGGDVLDEQSMGRVRLARFREPVAAVVAGPLACRGVRTVGCGRVGTRISTGCHTGRLGRCPVAVAARFPDFRPTSRRRIHGLEAVSADRDGSPGGRRSRKITPPAAVGRTGGRRRTVESRRRPAIRKPRSNAYRNHVPTSRGMRPAEHPGRKRPPTRSTSIDRRARHPSPGLSPVVSSAHQPDPFPRGRPGPVHGLSREPSPDAYPPSNVWRDHRNA